MSDITVEKEQGHSGYTERQLGLLKGDIKPADNDEWDYLQNHSSDVLPDIPKSPADFYGVDPDKMARDFERAGEPSKGAK